MTSERDIVATILKIFRERLLLEVDSPDQDLLSSGNLDSLRLVELLFQIEQECAVRIELDELDIEDLRSARTIAQVIVKQAVQVSHA
jgi:acyl carrier protein